MALHFVVTLKLKTVKKSNRQLGRSGTGSYRTATLLGLQLVLHLNLNESSSSGKKHLTALGLRHPAYGSWMIHHNRCCRFIFSTIFFQLSSPNYPLLLVTRLAVTSTIKTVSKRPKFGNKFSLKMHLKP